ncbi:uncharacterized protein LOC127881362 [Dreissena polymorpha]|uniref:uncharacterized protein LOC127881362 n=1 Tax=Dreissena polymorpha TaxID=45954 RepID=UPI002263EE21|nr:uncharacterized protein LOC127881362 [Dreissena polymorpha]
MSWTIEGEFPDFYVTINGVRCVGDSGKPNTIEKCASGNNKDEIWFKFEGEKNGKRLKRSLVEKGNTKFSSAISNAQFLEMCESMRIPVQRKGKKTVPACTSINVDHEVEPVPTPVPTEVHQDLKILKEKSAGFFTVDLDCLTAPIEELVVRCTDTTWVQQIKESMRSQPSRPVTRIPVLCEREIPPVDFCINTMHPLLTLGGNHMVTAMKDLLIEEAGNPDYECLRKVDVEVYVGLTPREAMFVGSWHNIQCSQKPMNFQQLSF